MAIGANNNTDFMSPTEMILSGNDGSASGSNNTNEGKGMDPYTQDKLLALAQAAYDAGNFDLAADLSALVDNGLAVQSKTMSAQKGEETKKETSTSKDSGAPTPDDKTKTEGEKAKQAAAQAPEEAPKKSGFSQSAANEKFREEYGKIAYNAYLKTGLIADALQVADDWASKNNGAVFVTTGKERTAEGGASGQTPEVALAADLKTSAVVTPVEDTPERQAMAKLVNFTDFPTFPFGAPESITLKTAPGKGKSQDGPDMASL